jgi:N-methylhydantoinase A
MALFVGTDIGGTFTDIVGYDAAENRLFFGKSLTDYSNLVEGVIRCLDDAGQRASAIDILKHGTTQIINTLLERRGARTALVATKGFGDILEIGRAGRPLPFDLDYVRQAALVPRHLRLELDERIDARGEVLLAPAGEAIEALADELQRLDVEAVAVAFINAYRNPAHEDAVAARLKVRLPHIYVTTSTALSREWFEYERMSTAVANAYVGRHAGSYLDRFAERLGGEGFAGRFFMMGSNGGILSVQRAKEQPIALVESGPIGGCIGAAVYAAALGADRLIAFDMGGTTAKCALVENQNFDVHSAYYVGGYEYGFPVQTPVLDIVEVGTGGGSIAHIDAHERLHVGPRSAGSEPGPVCFGRGGTEPTVADANLLLGRIGAGTFLGGALQLDAAAALGALFDKVGDRLGYARTAGPDAVASGIINLANAQMAMAIKEITIERGKDCRDFALFAFGGGGPLHAVSLARELHIGHVIVPPEPGNFSALGMLLADARIDETLTYFADLDAASVATLQEHIAGLRDKAAATLRRDFDAVGIRYEQHAEMRYKGQRHSLRIALTDPIEEGSLRAKFVDGYRRRYGAAVNEGAIEFVGLRVAGFAVTELPDLRRLHRAGSAGSAAPRDHRDIYFPEERERRRTPIFVRYGLPVGQAIAGPAVIEEFGATTVIGPREHLEVGSLGELRITLT